MIISKELKDAMIYLRLAGILATLEEFSLAKNILVATVGIH